MEKQQTKTIIIRIIAFVIIGIALFSMASVILLPEWVDIGDVSMGLRGFYEEPKNSLDVIFVGNSNVYRGVSPMAIWRETGIASYAYSSPTQKMWVSYYMIKECLTYQKPKAIFLDVDEVFWDGQAPEASIRKALDNMKLGSNKWEAINDPIFENNFLDKISYIFPIIRYHSRWDKIGERDIARLSLKYEAFNKGYLPSRITKPYNKKVERIKKGNKPIKGDQMGEKSKAYLEKIINLCKENNIKLILMELPTARSWSETKNQAILEYANQKELTFIDFNTEDIGIDWETDSEDEGYHLNRIGAEKVSKFLSSYLANMPEVPSHKGEEAYCKWEEDLEKYENHL